MHDSRTLVSPSNHSFKALLSRFQQLIAKHFHCYVDFVLFPELITNNPTLHIASSLLSKNSHVFLDGHLLMAIHPTPSQLLGYLQLSRPHGFSTLEISQLRDLIDLVLHSFSPSLERLNDLDQVENLVRLSHLPANVLRIDRGRSLRKSQKYPSLRYDNIDQDNSSSHHGSPQLFPPFFLQGPTYAELKKMALAIHELSGLPFFVYFEDLSEELRADATQLSQLNSLSLFIPEMQQLSPTSIATLVQYLTRSESKNEMQLIMSTTFSYEDLLLLPESLVSQIAQHIKLPLVLMQQDFQSYRETGLLAFLQRQSLNRSALGHSNCDDHDNS